MIQFPKRCTRNHPVKRPPFVLDPPKKRKRRTSSDCFSNSAQVALHSIRDEEEELNNLPEIKDFNRPTLAERSAWLKKYSIDPLDEHYIHLNKEIQSGVFQYQEGCAKNFCNKYRDWITLVKAVPTKESLEVKRTKR